MWATLLDDVIRPANELPLKSLPDGILEAYRLTIVGHGCENGTEIIRAQRAYNADKSDLWTLPPFKYHLTVHSLHHRELRSSSSMELTDWQWACLIALLRASDFWALPQDKGSMGMDGALQSWKRTTKDAIESFGGGIQIQNATMRCW